MNTREYQNYKRMTKMTVRFLEKDGTITDSKSKIENKEPTTTTLTTATITSATTRATTPIPTTTTARATTPISTNAETKVNLTTTTIPSKYDFLKTDSLKTQSTTTIPSKIEFSKIDSCKTQSTTTTSSKYDFLKTDSLKTQSKEKKEITPATELKFANLTDFNDANEESLTAKLTQLSIQKAHKTTNGRYINWSTQHSTLASLPWCCIGDLMTFCDKYEYRTISRNDPQMHNRIITEVKTILSGPAPFDIKKRFPSDIHSPENLWVCIGRCTGVEYHLNRILSVFRRPLDKLSADKQRMVRHDFHLAINELRLDISARISEVRLYDQNIFEKSFGLEWQEEAN